MKISKNLLQAILIGATLGTTVSSCELVRDNSEIVHEHTEECDEKCSVTENTTAKVVYDCGPCGMG